MIAGAPSRSRRHARRLLHSEGGAAAPLLGLIFLMLIGCIGLAIDTGRSMVVKARLTNALDAAGLAVGARVATTDFTADAKNYVTANFKANYGDATVTKVSAIANSDKTVITLAATATMPTAFMKLFGTSSVTVTATSEVTRASTGLELAMVLDNTGSMETSGSMPGLKSAATSLVNIVFGNDTTSQNLYVGLVPFSQAVNIGTNRPLWMNSAAPTKKYYPTYWLGCVEARQSGLDQTDDVPSVSDSKTLFNTYYSPNTYNALNPNSKASQVNPWIQGFLIFETLKIDYSNYSRPVGPSAYCPTEVTPLTNVKSKVVTGINNMKAAGSTMINLGAVWGWRMLSPNWRGRWGGDMDTLKLPLAYGSKNMSKAVVLMTDGENSFADDNYTAYGLLSESRLGPGANTSNTADGVLDTRLSTVCSRMKANGIYVYTVAFNIKNADTKKLLETCATSTSYYFDAANSSALNVAFQTIGGSLSKLRLSK